ncbi:hypothetical protein TTHERM_01039820 (macronuclear) [Tetrahymena thermophila SB210]|uniref:Uncharacterized protein n=1 Tax=Tetrahymena thermophila (strain SB210) TaxID=312017 RepID=Q24DA5_TETTS|nr:hypothetical protein TTHERM_01039820 [Tetrahymena thermophila SB210]EAS05740.2 hypothetical protein TTHERM_01039820 [Tetrahymena thermophila SB210]|eukprot:XP_001025985.2 hypothetical protein TTHERM_01039820 [Tetrahymena thermophila SB210]
MGCCSISPTNDGFRVELTEGFKQIINQKSDHDDKIFRKYNEFIEQENRKPQLISVLGRGRSVSQMNGTNILQQQNRINTHENIKYWYPRPSVQSRTSLSPLSRSSYIKNENMPIQQSQKMTSSYINQGDNRFNRSYSVISSQRSSQGAIYTQVSPLKVSPIKSNPSQNKQSILVVNDLSCQTNQNHSFQAIANNPSNQTNIWNQISQEINQFTSKKNRQKVKITLQSDKCQDFSQTEQILSQLTPQLANQGIIVSQQNIQFVQNNNGNKQLEVELQISQNQNKTDLEENINQENEVVNQVQEFTLQQESLNTSKVSSTKLQKGNQQAQESEKDINNDKEFNQYSKGSADSVASNYQYKKTSSSRISTNNNSRIDLGNNSNHVSASTQNLNLKNSLQTNTSLYSQISSQQQQQLKQDKQQQPQEIENDLKDDGQIDDLKALQTSNQSIQQFKEKHEILMNNLQQLKKSANESLNKSKLSHLKPDFCNQSSKLSRSNLYDEDSQMKSQIIENSFSQAMNSNGESKSHQTFAESIKKCQEIKKYLQNKIITEQMNKKLEIQDESLKNSRASFKEQKTKKTNQILQEISDMIQNSSSIYSSQSNFTKFHANSSQKKQNLQNNENDASNSSFNSSQQSFSNKDSTKISQLLTKLDKLNESYKRLNFQIESEIQNSKSSSLSSLEQDLKN